MSGLSVWRGWLGAWINHVVKPGDDPELVLRRAKLWCVYWKECRKQITFLGKWIAEHEWKKRPPVSLRDLKETFAWGEYDLGFEDYEHEDLDEDEEKSAGYDLDEDEETSAPYDWE